MPDGCLGYTAVQRIGYVGLVAYHLDRWGGFLEVQEVGWKRLMRLFMLPAAVN